jgi:hypothetical protein
MSVLHTYLPQDRLRALAWEAGQQMTMEEAIKYALENGSK